MQTVVEMVSITLSVNPQVAQKMKLFPEINWSGFVRNAIEKKIETMSWKESALKALQNEEEIDAWAVNLQRKARREASGRKVKGA